jgi:hypothetical protein
MIKSTIKYLDGYKISEGIGDSKQSADQAAFYNAVKKGFTMTMLKNNGYTIGYQSL